MADAASSASLPASAVPVHTWRVGDTLADFPRVALDAWERHNKFPVLFRGVPLESWGGSALWASPREHLEALIAAASPTARPKVSRESFFQYFFTPKQEEWRDTWGVEPPAMSFRWDMDTPADGLRTLLDGGRDAASERFGYWILQTGDVPDIAAAMSDARPSARAAFGSPALQTGAGSSVGCLRRARNRFS